LRRETGFATYSLLEIVVVVCLVLVLVAVAADRLLPLRGAAEQASFERTLGAMRSALGTAATAAVLKTPGMSGVMGLAGSDPMDLLEVSPPHETGTEFPQDGIGPGRWFFARSSGILYYGVRYPQYFHGGHGRPPVIRLEILVEAGTSDAAANTLQLRVLDPYSWSAPEDEEESVNAAAKGDTSDGAGSPSHASGDRT
jgi:type II secretory pathway pseudopilin PulG